MINHIVIILLFLENLPSLELAGIFFLLLYGIYLLLVWIAVVNYPPTSLDFSPPHFRFSIVIPFKDEAANLPVLLKSLKKLKYPAGMYEILLVDDHSTDMSVQIVQKSGFVRYVAGQGEGKKQALLSGIKKAEYEWIVTTDADCMVPENWLQFFNTSIHHHHPKMLLGPVKFIDQNTFLSKFQQFEFLSLQAMTIAGVYWKHPFLSNGANFAFDKQAFYEVKAYEGNLQIASGDDVFLLEKFNKKYPRQISFIKNAKAVVNTRPQPGLKSLLQQKIRWAGKTKYYQSVLPKFIGVIVVLANLLLFTAWISSGFSSVLTGAILIKFIMDTLLIYTMAKIYKTKFYLFDWLLTFLLYPFYIIYLGANSFRSDFNWKGRRYH